MNGFENFELSRLSDSNFVSAHSTDSNQQFFQDQNNRFHCAFPDCGKIFKFKSEVNKHIVTHFNNRPFVCQQEGCRKSFKRADALDAHLLTHKKDLPFECEVAGCNKRFSTKAILKYHLLKHNNDRVFVCSFAGCDRTFFTKGQLKQHEKAATYHMNLAKQSAKPEDLRCVLSTPSTDLSEQNPDSYPSSPSYIPNIDWESSWKVLSEQVEESEVRVDDGDNERESFESIVKYILKDNGVAEKQQYLIQDDEPGFVMDKKEWSESMRMESGFMDEDELKIFNFLKEQQFLSF